jgi:CheY-like chemotaxis protein
VTRPRIVVLEDDPALRELIVELLSADYAVTAHERLNLQELLGAKPDLLIADVHLEDDTVGGWRLVRECRAHPRGRALPIVLSTADSYWLHEHAAELAAISHLDVLPRPFGLDELFTVVRRALGQVSIAHELDTSHFVLVADAQGRLIAATRIAIETLQIQPADLPGLPVADIVALPPDWTDAEWDRYLAERWWRGPVTLRDRTGAEISAEATARIVGDGDSTQYVSWIRLGDPLNVATR